jgi:hypothetical protein
MSGVKVIRNGPDGSMLTPVELKKTLEAKVSDIPVKPDDILFVPSSYAKVTPSRTAEFASAATIVAVQ